MNWGDLGLAVMFGVSLGLFFATHTFISLLLIALFGILLLWWVETHPHYQKVEDDDSISDEM
jgi:hypothetical protein